MAKRQHKTNGSVRGTETRPLWKDYERVKRQVFGEIKATGWKPA